MDGDHTALEVIEHQQAVLVRNFELLHRRSDVHADLDRAEYLLLRMLAEHGSQDINSLAALLGLDPSTAGRQVTSLRRQGLVAGAPAPADRRRSVITPTPAGLRRMEGVRARRAENLAHLLAGWSESDLRALGVMFAKYNGAVAARYLTGATAPARPTPVPEPGTGAGRGSASADADVSADVSG
ncbi:MarR family winged helix-turn-helix transcriptional regulator [Actinacidiphila sp. ITFR-21]|uniref:MarR family winged helix-turn-helix transcriptional regulator n=1 Tax=Actinacidiphila sp. ITFR-21 TaxID=3075199 RepID=UPI0028891560|nr:MarR family winged helix-turn-helix transcriptional regulator [Streptomyces sp. ITFR-21]WNI16475.1 MarR family winged helix-turn-helix transcriptional regulator [Streptomyces sp. ITFR-21]